MVRGKLENGFEFEIDEEMLDDMRFIELLSATYNDPVKVIDLANFALGSEQKERLYKHLEDEKGRVKTQAFSDAMEEIFEKAGETVKNS